jgi:hypothetical protein
MCSDSDEIGKDNRNKSIHLKGSTFRSYPKRNKLQKEITYKIDVFESESEYDKYCLNKLLLHKSIDYKSPDTYDRYVFLWKFANDAFDTNLEKGYFDINYQELSNLTGCKVIVNENLDCEFDKCVALTDHIPDRFRGGGSTAYIEYNQRGSIIDGMKMTKEDKNNIIIFCPIQEEENNTKVILIHAPIPKDNYQYYTQMKKLGTFTNTCKSCFNHQGRMWMLKGLGKKSHCKTKGMHKIFDKETKLY